MALLLTTLALVGFGLIINNSLQREGLNMSLDTTQELGEGSYVKFGDNLNSKQNEFGETVDEDNFYRYRKKYGMGPRGPARLRILKTPGTEAAFRRRLMPMIKGSQPKGDNPAVRCDTGFRLKTGDLKLMEKKATRAHMSVEQPWNVDMSIDHDNMRQMEWDLAMRNQSIKLRAGLLPSVRDTPPWQAGWAKGVKNIDEKGLPVRPYEKTIDDLRYGDPKETYYGRGQTMTGPALLDAPDAQPSGFKSKREVARTSRFNTEGPRGSVIRNSPQYLRKNRREVVVQNSRHNYDSVRLDLPSKKEYITSRDMNRSITNNLRYGMAQGEPLPLDSRDFQNMIDPIRGSKRAVEEYMGMMPKNIDIPFSHIDPKIAEDQFIQKGKHQEDFVNRRYNTVVGNGFDTGIIRPEMEYGTANSKGHIIRDSDRSYGDLGYLVRGMGPIEAAWDDASRFQTHRHGDREAEGQTTNPTIQGMDNLRLNPDIAGDQRRLIVKEGVVTITGGDLSQQRYRQENPYAVGMRMPEKREYVIAGSADRAKDFNADFPTLTDTDAFLKSSHRRKLGSKVSRNTDVNAPWMENIISSQLNPVHVSRTKKIAIEGAGGRHNT